MTEQEKQELIECCKLMIDVSRNHEEVMIARIALASLTAPPVKLPKIKHPAQFDYADEVVGVLKSHGYEVEE